MYGRDMCGRGMSAPNRLRRIDSAPNRLRRINFALNRLRRIDSAPNRYQSARETESHERNAVEASGLFPDGYQAKMPGSTIQLEVCDVTRLEVGDVPCLAVGDVPRLEADDVPHLDARDASEIVIPRFDPLTQTLSQPHIDNLPIIEETPWLWVRRRRVVCYQRTMRKPVSYPPPPLKMYGRKRSATWKNPSSNSTFEKEMKKFLMSDNDDENDFFTSLRLRRNDERNVGDQSPSR